MIPLADCCNPAPDSRLKDAGEGVVPSVVLKPSEITPLCGQMVSAIFAEAATGTAPLAYQWFKNGAPLPGATPTMPMPFAAAAMVPAVCVPCPLSS